MRSLALLCLLVASCTSTPRVAAPSPTPSLSPSLSPTPSPSPTTATVVAAAAGNRAIYRVRQIHALCVSRIARAALFEAVDPAPGTPRLLFLSGEEELPSYFDRDFQIEAVWTLRAAPRHVRTAPGCQGEVIEADIEADVVSWKRL